MQSVVVLSCLLALACAKVDLAGQWKLFKSTYSKSYASPAEELVRAQIFNNNLKTIEQLNSRGGATFAVNKFADLTSQEFKSQYLNYQRREFVDAPLFTPVNDEAGDIDWTQKGSVITPVKDQGQCGSCWAFSAVEESESMWVLAGKSQQILSPQQVVSCDTVDAGCNGGDTPTAYQYIQSAKGLELDSTYPYTSGSTGYTGQCNFDSSQPLYADNSGFTYASPPCRSSSCSEVNEQTLLQSLNSAPISICVNAEPWQFYSGGVMSHNDCDGSLNSLDHCVQLTGYQSNSGSPYWMVRNSWNTDWGNNGYIYLEYGYNTCGVADEATIPTIAV